MIRKVSILLILFLLCLNVLVIQAQDITTVIPKEFSGGISNPLMGFRPDLNSYSKYDYPTITRHYIRWNEIENTESDGVDKIISFCNTKWAGVEAANVKVIPRVYLFWDENSSTNAWPADLPRLDWKNPKLKERVVKMIEKLGKAWDNDPRVAWIQTGIIGKWGEQESPVGVGEDGWAALMGKAFKEAFPNKMTIVRNQDVWEAQGYKFGVYWDSFAHPGQKSGSWSRIIDANSKGSYLTQVVEGEVAYNWGTDVLVPVLGNNENETVSTPKYYNYAVDVIRELHCSGLGWIASYDPTKPENTVGASEVQKAFGYRFMLNEFTCPKRIEKGGKLDISFKLKNIGSAPFYEKWPVAVVLIDETTKNIVWTEILPDIDTRTWVPGNNYDYASRSYTVAAPEYTINKSVTVPSSLSNGKYMVGLTILEPYSRKPGVFFAVKNFLKESQTQPLCRIGIGEDVTGSYQIDTVLFSDPVKDDKRSYTLIWNGPTYSLTTTAMTGGTVSPSSTTLNENQKVTLKATPNLGYVFTGWSGDVTGTENPVIVTMDKNKSISANFTSVPTYSLTVNAPNATVELTPTGGVYNTGTAVSILIKPNLGYIFSGWSGDLSGTTNPATITMNSNKVVTATLTAAPVYTLTTNASGGSITLDPAGPQYTKGTRVKVTAKPDPGYTFSFWSGDPLEDEFYINPNFITMSSDKNITATFIGPPPATGFWVETFDMPDGTTSDTGSTAWTATRSSGIFGVLGNRFAINNAGPEGVFSTSKIDISGGSVDVSVDVEGVGGLDPETSSSKDYFGIFVKVDGGAEQIVYEIYGAQPAKTVTKTGIIGDTLEIVIKGYTTAADEFYYFNNLRVAYTNPTLLKNGDFSAGLNDWSSQVISPAAGNISVVNKECKVEITAVDGQPWHINILQSGVKLETNMNYTFSFDARATTTKSVVVKAQFDHDPWTSSLEEPVTISNVMKKYNVTWLQSQPADNYKVGLFFGTDTADVWVTNLRIASTATSINDKVEKIVPTYTYLEQNYPNPFNPSTTISYQLGKATFVKLRIFNLLGQNVATIVDAYQHAGYYSVNWNSKDSYGNQLASGIYFYRIETENFAQNKKLSLLR